MTCYDCKWLTPAVYGDSMVPWCTSPDDNNDWLYNQRNNNDCDMEGAEKHCNKFENKNIKNLGE